MLASPNCPRCGGAWRDGGGPIQATVRCTACGATWLDGPQARSFLVDRVRIAPEVLRELAAQGTRSALACVGCGAATRSVVVKGTTLDACSACGGLFFDAGELAKVARDPRAEPPAPAAMVPRPSSSSSVYGDDAALPGRPTLGADVVLDEWFGGARTIAIKQLKEWAEVLFGFEAANKYVVVGGSGAGSATENTEGLFGVLRRLVLQTHRPFDIDVVDPRGRPTMNLSRPFFWLFSSMRVEGADGAPIGHVQRRFAFLTTIYDVADAGGRIVARVKKPWWRIWRFPVVDAQDRDVASVEKRWGGFFREAFTDSDKYVLTFLDDSLPSSTRGLLLATAINIDLDTFENNTRRSRSGLLGQ